MDQRTADMAKIARLIYGDKMEADAQKIFGPDGQLDPFIQRAALLSLSLILKSQNQPIKAEDAAMVLFFLVYDISEMAPSLPGDRMKPMLEAKVAEMGDRLTAVEGYLAWDALTAVEKQIINSKINPTI